MWFESSGPLGLRVAAADPIIEIPDWLIILGWATAGVAVVASVMLGAALTRRWLQRRRVSHAAPDQQREWRGQFIEALITRVGRDIHRSAPLGWICKRLGWTRGHADLIMGYLTAKDLVEKTAWMRTMGEPLATVGAFFGGERVRLTAAGLDEAERAGRGPTEHLPHITAINSVVVTGPDANVSAAVNSPASTQLVHQEGLDQGAVTEWIGDYWEALTAAGVLSAAERAQAEHLLVRLDEANRRGDHERVTKLGGALRVVAEGVAGNAAYAALAVAARSLFG
jgi:hypothetical protein